MKKTVYLFLLLAASYFIASHYVEKRFFDHSAVTSEYPSDGYRVLIFWKSGLGEREFIQRLEKTGAQLGWQVYTCSTQLTFLEKLFLRDPIKKTLETVQPDFTLTLQGDQCYLYGGKNYRCLSGSFLKYFDTKSSYNAKALYSFDGFLPSFEDISMLKKFIEEERSFHGFHWYPTCQATEYTPVTPHHIFYSGNNWDSKRKSEEYRKMFSLLDEKGYMEIYGPKEKWQHTPHSARGLLPFDGVSLLEKMKEAGITLVLHSQTHLDEGAATARIFEAAAACTVIICDRHPFVEREFKDAVLYIDQDLPGEEVADQIDMHREWILNHPEEALEKAKKAHQIFLKKYTLQDQLRKLSLMHQAVKAEKNS